MNFLGVRHCNTGGSTPIIHAWQHPLKLIVLAAPIVGGLRVLGFLCCSCHWCPVLGFLFLAVLGVNALAVEYYAQGAVLSRMTWQGRVLKGVVYRVV